MNSSALAEMLRHEWGIESFASVNIRSLVYNNIRNLTVLWFPMKTNISGCCSKTEDDNVNEIRNGGFGSTDSNNK